MADDVRKFEVRYDPNAKRLRWTMRGFWTMGDVAGFANALRTAVAPLGPPPHSYDALADSREFPVQTVEVSLALGEIDRIGEKMRKGRMAVVVGSMMNKMQVERTLNDDVRVFRTLEGAEAWLKQPAAAL